MRYTLAIFIARLIVLALLMASAWADFMIAEKRNETIETQKNTIELLRKKDHAL